MPTGEALGVHKRPDTVRKFQRFDAAQLTPNWPLLQMELDAWRVNGLILMILIVFKSLGRKEQCIPIENAPTLRCQN
jgi:hypothetical protein